MWLEKKKRWEKWVAAKKENFINFFLVHLLSFKLLLFFLLTTALRWWVLDLNLGEKGNRIFICWSNSSDTVWFLSWIPSRLKHHCLHAVTGTQFLCSFSAWERQFSKFQTSKAPDIQNNVHLIVLSASVVIPVCGITRHGKRRGEQGDEKPSAPVYT